MRKFKFNEFRYGLRRASILDVLMWSVIAMASFVAALDIRDWWFHQ